MGLLDVLAGRVPLFRSTQRQRDINSIESEFSSLLNSKSTVSNRYIPAPSASVAYEAETATANRPRSVSSRYTLKQAARVKVLDTEGAEWDVYITVPGQGTTAFASHDATRVITSSAGLHEGIPLVSNPALSTRITPNHLKWKGEMWLSGDTDNMVVDVEAS